jgi:hypothetical protein
MTVMLAAAAATSTSWINLDAVWKIIVLGLICGAGLPAVFAIGLRLLSLPAVGTGTMPASDEDDRIYFGNVGGAIGAAVCFAIVLAAIALGIYWIVTS